MKPAAALLALLIGCASEPEPANSGSFIVSDQSATFALDSFVERIPGTTASFEMILVPRQSMEGAGAGGLYMARTELTWDVFDVFLHGLDEWKATGADAESTPTQPYVMVDRGFGHAGYPALSMSAKNAEAFCRWLSEKTGKRYRLPTEQEWRHAAIARLNGAEPEDVDPIAWHAGNSAGRTHPVASRRANAWGFHDLFGNVGEWCSGPDGLALRGGTFRDPQELQTSQRRQLPVPAWNQSDPQIPKSPWWLADAAFVGMRVVCENP